MCVVTGADSRLLDDARPSRLFGFPECSELFRTRADNVEAIRCKFVPDIRVPHRLENFGVEPFDDITRCAPGQQSAVPVDDFHAGKRFAQCRDAWQYREASRTGRRQRNQASCLDVLQADRYGFDTVLHPAAQEIVESRCAALVWNAAGVDAARESHELTREMRQTAITARRPRECARICFGVSDEVAQRLDRQRWVEINQKRQ